LGLIIVIGVAVLTPIFMKTGDPAPFCDSVITVASLVAEYMLCIKLYEAWPVYAAADLVSLAVLAFLGAWITFGTYLLFFALCIMGMLEWSKRMQKDFAPESSLASSIP
jgi:nicotinamide mononucleotide transporter